MAAIRLRHTEDGLEILVSLFNYDFSMRAVSGCFKISRELRSRKQEEVAVLVRSFLHYFLYGEAKNSGLLQSLNIIHPLDISFFREKLLFNIMDKPDWDAFFNGDPPSEPDRVPPDAPGPPAWEPRSDGVPARPTIEAVRDWLEGIL